MLNFTCYIYCEEIIIQKHFTQLLREDAMRGIELKLKRIKAGSKQYKVAALVGIPANRLCEIEIGRRKGTPDLLAHLQSLRAE